MTTYQIVDTRCVQPANKCSTFGNYDTVAAAEKAMGKLPDADSGRYGVEPVVSAKDRFAGFIFDSHAV